MSVPIEDLQATFAATLVDEWLRAGVADAVLCPGSRSTPLALALAGRAELALHVRLDERSACFYAVGLALASGRPSVVCTTSGTAAAELHAGVAEASHAGVPLIVCTADRPSRLHHVGAPQTIEQGRLFGSAVRWFADPGPVRGEDRRWWRSFARRAVLEALVGGGGPVHLNLAFEEPLVGRSGPLPPGDGPPEPDRGRADRVDLGPTRRWRGRGMLVAGADAGPPGLLVAVAERLGWPLLADPRSGARVQHPAVVASADALLRVPEVAEAAHPDTVALFGRPWASRVLSEFVSSAGRSGAEVVAFGRALSDPGRVVATFVEADPAGALRMLAATAGVEENDPAWRRRWSGWESAAQGALSATLAHDPLSADGRATEPGVARHLFGSLAGSDTLFVAASMPTRDLEWYGAPRPEPPRVLSNRGANGIDGVVSSALGAAAGGRSPVVALLGDLAFLHDLSGLVSVGEERGSCTLVVLDNGGGGIFNFLPQAERLDPVAFERLFGTPPTTSIAAAAEGLGAEVCGVATLAELDDALAARRDGRRRVVHVRVPTREQNVALHERLHAAVADSVRACGGR